MFRFFGMEESKFANEIARSDFIFRIVSSNTRLRMRTSCLDSNTRLKVFIISGSREKQILQITREMDFLNP